MSLLLLLRHAKSDWTTGAPDHDRPLNPRGCRDARAAGRLLAEHGWQPDLVLCSSATRTRQTWAGAVDGGARADDLRIEPRIYEATAAELLRLVRAADPAVERLLVLGHGPGLPDLAHELAGVNERYPTAALAVIELDEPWPEIERGRLVAYEVPRGRDLS